ncbi:Pr6Pr family membrane protein [Jongsikchunia kroppenstedtii]|uniref:Pr6Pr family membrane protein n=1 Tax=Jongsikchunia kroppenstedtii TaxID=1121721 RepID=UPI000362A945|nr:Pr6Pr family membrane protein [Jongsikchunia kroppenstedtii]
MSLDVDLDTLHRTWWVRTFRLAAAALGLAALITLPVNAVDKNGSFDFGNYFSYFTVLSNVLAVAVLLVGALAVPSASWFTWLRGLATTCMVVTAVVYAMLLRNIDVQLNTQWINDVMHRYLPLIMVIDWIVLSARNLPARSWISWLTAPLVYGVYSLIRGPIVDWYPYPFIDPRSQGYGSMVVSLIIVFAGMIAMSAGVAWLGTRTLGRPKPTDPVETPTA